MDATDMPVGFTMTMAQDADALTAFAAMDEKARSSVIERAKRVSSREEMQRLVHGMAGRRG